MKALYKADVITIAMFILFVFGQSSAWDVMHIPFTPNLSGYKETIIRALSVLWLIPAIFIFFSGIESIKQRILTYVVMVFMFLLSLIFFVLPPPQLIDCYVIENTFSTEFLLDCINTSGSGERTIYKALPGSIIMELVTD